MSLVSQLKKVEKAAGVGERCLTCRVHYIKYGDEVKRTAQEDLYITVCAACGFPLKLIHSGYTQRDREVLISVSCASERRQNSVKWLAAYAWMNHLPRYGKIQGIGEAEEKRLREVEKQEPAARRQVKLLDEYNRMMEREKKALERRKENRDEETSELALAFKPVTDAITAVREQRILDHDLMCFTMMAEMEVFMWGAKSKETLKLIADRQAEIEAKKERDRAAEEERKRVYEEEKCLREEKYQRERDERLGVSRPVVVEQPVSVQPPAPVQRRPAEMSVAASIARSQGTQQRPSFQELVRDEVNPDWRTNQH